MNIIQVYKQFPTEESCIKYLEEVRWGSIPKCPYCKSDNSTSMKNTHRHHCNNCNTSYSVTVGTIFHKTKMDLQKWFLGISLILNAKKGLSARQLSRDLEINKNTAWYMGMRIRNAMLDDGELLQGIVEMDETYVGGKPRKGMKKRKPLPRGRGTKKPAVIGMVERGGKVKTNIPHGRITSKCIARLVRQNIDCDESTLMTDEFNVYKCTKHFIEHKSVNHQLEYVNGEIHTNTIEGFWSLLKRGIVGQYHKVSLKYLKKYLDEFAFRYNNRDNEEVFELTIKRALGA